MISQSIEEYKKKNPRIFIIPLLTTLTLILGFGLGIIVSSAIQSSKTGIFSTVDTTTTTTPSTNYDSTYFDNVFKVIQQNYITNLPDKENVTYGMIKGLISSLNDRYTSFLTPTEAKAYNDAKDPTFQGIGVTLSFANNYTQVETVLSGYPAEKAGILSNDVILQVDGQSMEGQFPSVVSSKIRGEADTQVKVQIFRPKTNETKDFTLTRQKIEVTNVSFNDEGNGIFKINIAQFVDKTPDDFDKAWDDVVAKVKAQNPKKIIVDLRNNPGGYVLSVRHVLEDFMKTGTTLMQEKERDKDPVVYKDERVGAFENLPVEVLVNEGSASASEIFSSSIQDNKRGVVIGKPTVGKGVEQELIDDFSDKSLLILVFQQWLSPNGREITKEKPITPDYIVDYSVDNFKAGNDTQLQKALDLFK